MDNVDMTTAIQELLRPFWEATKVNETLDEFAEAFFTAGGRVNIQMPDWLKDRLGLEQPKEEELEGQFIWPPGEKDV